MILIDGQMVGFRVDFAVVAAHGLFRAPDRPLVDVEQGVYPSYIRALSARMQKAGAAIHGESQLQGLLADLARALDARA